MSPAFLGLVLVLVITLISVRRQYCLYPFILGTILIPISQVIVVMGFHWQAERIIIMTAGLRCLAGRFSVPKSWSIPMLTAIDKRFLLWVLSNCVVFTLQWGEIGALTNRLGFAFTSVGTYLVLRILIRDNHDVDRAITALAIAALLCGCVMLAEQATGRNFITAVTGQTDIVTSRDGKLRAQASFAHPLLAGAFGAALLPVFVGLWWKRRDRVLVPTLGIVGGLLMAVASMSSTSLMDVLIATLCLGLWPLRRHMRRLRWILLTCLVATHLVMKAPVWALIARIDLMGGSSGYHRYMLVDQAIRHFGEWWLVGTRTQSLWGWDMWDSIDWYVNEATNGGALTLGLFVSVLVYGFKRIGNARRVADTTGDRPKERFIWALGAALFTNALSFLGISYFDQSFIMWCAFLVIVSTATEPSGGLEQRGETSAALNPQQDAFLLGYA
jgi:hypothetical protein